MSAIGESQSLGPPQITSIVSFSKGFACSCGPGTVAWFEKTDDKEYFKKVCVSSSLVIFHYYVKFLKGKSSTQFIILF